MIEYKKIISNTFLYTLLAIILLIPCVTAYNTNDLKAYYGFEQTNMSKIIDSQGLYNSTNTSEYCKTHINGIKGYTINAGSCASPYPQGYNITIPDLSQYNSYTINFWINFTNTNSEKFIGIGYNNTIEWNTRYTVSTYFTLYNSTSTILQANQSLSGNWHLITITHDQSTNKITLYIDSTEIGQATIHDLTIGSNKLFIGEPYPAFINEQVDELSVWNTTLNIFDIAKLYNIGYGINYTDTLLNNVSTLTTTPVCMDNHNLCNHPLFFDGNYYCEEGDTSYCSIDCLNLMIDNSTNQTYISTYNTCTQYIGNSSYKQFDCSVLNTFPFYGHDIIYNLFSCGLTTNIINVTYATCDNSNVNEIIYNNPGHTFITGGSCDNGQCNNECNILGYQTCNSMTTFNICGNYDTDTCLEYSGDFSCMPGETCNNGYCTLNTGSGLKNVTAFTVSPYATSSDSTNYNNDQSKKTLTVKTKNYIQVQTFSTNSNTNTTYTSRTCDYTEQEQTRQSNQVLINETAYSFTNQGVTSKVLINLTPTDLNNVSIKIIDSTGSLLTTNYLYRNISEKSLCLYNSTYGLMYCDYSVNLYDDLSSVVLIYDFEFQSKMMTLKVDYARSQSNSKTFYQTLFNNNDYAQINISSNNVTLNQIRVLTYTQPKGFTLTSKGDYNYLPCTYSTTGCKVVRTYNNIDGQADFSNYYDYNICINALNAGDVSNPNDDIVLSKNEKALYSFILIIISIIVVGGFCAFSKNGGVIAMGALAGIIVGAVISVACGYMNGGVAMLIGIADAGIIVVVFRLLNK